MLILVLGGARSGKSHVAEALAGRLPRPVTYVATLIPDSHDHDLCQRIEAHRRRRPAAWRTTDAERDLAAQLQTFPATVLLDSLGPWVSAHHPNHDAAQGLAAMLAARPGDSVVVSDEVGMSVHPSTSAGRAFRDELGAVNSAIAALADHTLLVVAGRVIRAAELDLDGVLGSAR